LKIGLFFGSFNPIHTGHLIIANAMAETTDLEQIWFVVSPQNPHKKSKSLAHQFDRYDMVEAAVADNHKLKVADVEFDLPKPSYTIDTLTYLGEKYSDHQFSLIIGSDNLQSFPRWKNYKVMLSEYHLYVYPRIGNGTSPLDDHDHVHKVDAPLIQISATYIRSLISSNKSIKYLVPESVAGIIQMRHLYQ